MRKEKLFDAASAEQAARIEEKLDLLIEELIYQRAAVTRRPAEVVTSFRVRCQQSLARKNKQVK